MLYIHLLLIILICLNDVECYQLAPKSHKNILSSIANVLSSNPFSRIISNTYDFFYWFPKKNLPYDIPFVFFKNSSSEWIAWYQFPHNLPPYNYVGEGFPEDMFCYGLPGNTLPLGNWDPCGFQLVPPKVVKKYRESEIKHGRLAMLATLGCMVQEIYHPLHKEIGGLSITHMNQLMDVSLIDSSIFTQFTSQITNILDLSSPKLLQSLSTMPLDYLLVISLLASIEILGLQRNWNRWEDDEYDHPFDHNIGLGNLKASYSCGDYGFDPLNLRPVNEEEYQWMVAKELNHGRLAMIAFLGILFQEYCTGLPIFSALGGDVIGTGTGGASVDIFSMVLEAFRAVGSFPDIIISRLRDTGFDQMTQEGAAAASRGMTL